MKSSTENMLVDIDSVPESGDALHEIEFLSRLDSWKQFSVGLVPKWNLFRYIIIMYSKDSFLNVRNPIPLQERKQRALKFAKIKNTDEVTNQILLLENDLVLKMIQDYIIAQDYNLWTEIITTEQQYEEAIRLRLQPIKKGDKDKDQLTAANLKKTLRIDCKEMKADLERFYKQLYQDHDDLKDKVKAKSTTLESISKTVKHV